MPKRLVRLVVTVSVFSSLSAGAASEPATPAPSPSTWAFAVSGDSRDCGDVIMPRIAQAVLAERTPPTQFYWHLGDFRRISDIDCDIVKRKHPGFNCKDRVWDQVGDDEMSDYGRMAWDDFIEHQVRPFGSLPVYLGIGNHELYGRTREDFRKAFQPWLSQKLLHAQRLADNSRKIGSEVASTYYRFVTRGVDFINLDNADEAMFSRAQLLWLKRVLAEDAKDATIRTIVVGMHAALPYSTSRGHAMDKSCQGLCSGQQAYDMLFRAQNLGAPPEKQKHVYVLASHVHAFLENVYDTPEHAGQVLPGWIVGTAGAIQSADPMAYGYLRVEVGSDGVLTPRFRQVTRSSLPAASGPGADALDTFCFESNTRKEGDEAFKGDCLCGAVPEVTLSH